jgi:hypothetical protein
LWGNVIRETEALRFFCRPARIEHMFE